MKKSIVLVLLFFLAFPIQIALARVTRCRHYVDGVCQYSGGYYYIEEIEPTGSGAPTYTKPTYTEPPRFIVLVFQFIGIIVLVALFVLTFDELLKKMKSKKTRKHK